MSPQQRCAHRSKTRCQTLKHFDVFAKDGNNIVEVFERLTTSPRTMDTPLSSGHLMSSLQQPMAVMLKVLPSSGTKWRPIMTYILPPWR